MAEKKGKSDEEILKEARERLKRCIDDNADNRKNQRDDLRFCTLDQWPSDVRSQRENDQENGPRPCLTIDQINQYLDQVVNDGLQNRPSVKIRPVDDGGDVETAEVFQGIIRQIEDQSVAEIAYGAALRSGVRVGEGYCRVLTEYENENSFNQVIRIKPIQDTFCCYLSYHVMPDGSDAEYGFVFEDVPEEVFKRLYPGKKFQSADFDELTGFSDYWLENKKIRVAEYFYFDYAPATLLFLDTGRTILASEYEKLPEPKPEVTDQRETRTRSVKWCKLTGLEILEKRDWAGKYIPIAKVIGKESWLDGAHTVWGLVRPAKDSLRMYNYWASTITEKIALSPKTPYIGAKGQFESMEDRWQQANRKNFSYLEYNPVSIDGLSVPAPQRQQASPVEVAMVQQLQIIREDVQASLGMYRAALGREQPNQSGKAILALTRESDTGTFHFANNHKLMIQYVGRILVDLIPKIMDTKQIIRILGEDGKVQTAEINPDQQKSREDIQLAGKIKKIYNLGVGTYDVTATVGPSYNTKRMEAAALFTDLANGAKDPVSAAVVRYLAIKNSDFNGAEQAADMLEKMLPPGIVDKEGQPPLPPQVAMQMQQMGQAIQQLQQELQQEKAGTNVAMAKVGVSQKEGQAKVAAAHDEKMAQLALDEKVEVERARLARESAERDATLEREKAEHKAKIDEYLASCKAKIDEENCAREKKMSEEKIKFDRDTKMAADPDFREVSLLPQVLEAVEKMGNGIATGLQQLASLQQKTLDAQQETVAILKEPKSVSIGALERNDKGKISGATVTVN